MNPLRLGARPRIGIATLAVQTKSVPRADSRGRYLAVEQTVLVPPQRVRLTRVFEDYVNVVSAGRPYREANASIDDVSAERQAPDTERLSFAAGGAIPRARELPHPNPLPQEEGTRTPSPVASLRRSGNHNALILTPS
jgi:hypothetical protein